MAFKQKYLILKQEKKSMRNPEKRKTESLNGELQMLTVQQSVNNITIYNFWKLFFFKNKNLFSFSNPDKNRKTSHGKKNSPLTLHGFNQPFQLCPCYSSDNWDHSFYNLGEKNTSTQTQAHKYLSVRTKRTEFSCAFLRYSTSQFQSSSAKERSGRWGGSWHRGLVLPLALFAGEIRSGLCDRETHIHSGNRKNRTMPIKMAHCTSRAYRHSVQLPF